LKYFRPILVSLLSFYQIKLNINMVLIYQISFYICRSSCNRWAVVLVVHWRIQKNEHINTKSELMCFYSILFLFLEQYKCEKLSYKFLRRLHPSLIHRCMYSIKAWQRSYLKNPKATMQHLLTGQWVNVMPTWPYTIKTRKTPIN
jgi:hypothetical protein